MATYVLMAVYIFTFTFAFIASFWLIAIDVRHERALLNPEDSRQRNAAAERRDGLPRAGKDPTRTGDDAPVSATSTREARTMFQVPALYVLGAIAFAIALMLLFAFLRH